MPEYESESCYKCGKPTRGIYVRAQKDGIWGPRPVCDECYVLVENHIDY
jgi:hypothetical protein